MVPVFARTAPCAGPSSSRCWSVPETPATGSAFQRTSRRSGSRQLSRSSEVTARAVRRSSSDRPEPSTIWTPASGTPAAARLRIDDRVAGGGRSRAADLGAEVLQQQLGDVVVAVVIHLREDVRQRLRVHLRQRSGAGRRPCRARSGPVVIPRARSACRNFAAAEIAGESAKRLPTRSPSATSADSGGHSSRKNDAFQPGAVRTVSNHDSSAIRRPVTRRIPALASWFGEPLQPERRRASGRRIPSARGCRARSLRPASRRRAPRCGTRSRARAP